MVAALGHASYICIKCLWNLSRFQRNILIELRPRRNNRFVIRMQSFKDTPQIHLTIPLSTITNCLTSSVLSGQVLLPYKSTFTHMLKTSPVNFVRIARLVRFLRMLSTTRQYAQRLHQNSPHIDQLYHQDI